MIEKVKSFLATHGFTIMISGFSISAAGILLYMYFTQPQHFNRLYSSIAFDATCTGIGFYVIGRSSVRRNVTGSGIQCKRTTRENKGSPE
jgi:hypothetical protein